MAFSYLGQPIDSEARPNCSHEDISVNEEANNDGQHSTVPETSSDDDPDRRCHELPHNTTGTETVVVAEESCGPWGINEPEDCLEMDWTEKEVCIKCDKGGKLLVCCDSNCPLAVHEGCMQCLARFDSRGNFYCPYCSYKRAMMETRKARKKAMLAKKALSDFLDKEMMNGDPHKKNAVRVRWKVPNPSAVVVETENDDTRNRLELDGDEVDNHLVQMEEDHQHEERFDPECTTIICFRKGAKASAVNEQNDALSRCVDNARAIDDGQHKIVIEQHMHQGPIIARGGSGGACSREEETGHRFEIVHVDKSVQAEHPELVEEHQNETKLDGSLHISTEGELNNAGIVKEDEGRRPEEEAMQDQVKGTTVSSSGGDSMQQEHAKVRDSLHGGSGDVSPRWRHIKKKSQNVVQPPNMVHKEKKNPTIKSRQRITSPTVPHGRRKKLPWTAEEEEMLKEGVQKFSTMVNKNLPWRKILEFGHHVFDGTRTPVDLKDKWRNILFKECSTK